MQLFAELTRSTPSVLHTKHSQGGSFCKSPAGVFAMRIIIVWGKRACLLALATSLRTSEALQPEMPRPCRQGFRPYDLHANWLPTTNNLQHNKQLQFCMSQCCNKVKCDVLHNCSAATRSSVMCSTSHLPQPWRPFHCVCPVTVGEEQMPSRALSRKVTAPICAVEENMTFNEMLIKLGGNLGVAAAAKGGAAHCLLALHSSSCAADLARNPHVHPAVQRLAMLHCKPPQQFSNTGG
jgi:hypothetical protein